jgi:hypothetical protein
VEAAEKISHEHILLAKLQVHAQAYTIPNLDWVPWRDLVVFAQDVSGQPGVRSLHSFQESPGKELFYYRLQQRSI